VETRTRSADWWAHLFRVRHRATIPGIAEWDGRLVAFLVEVLALRPGQRVLDVACGSGEHLALLAARGVHGVGFDLSRRLVRHAAARAPEGVEYRAGDMRDIGAVVGDDRFDAVTLLSGSFGFFDDAGNRRVLQGMGGALAPGGRMLLDCIAPAAAPQACGEHRLEVDGGELVLETRWEAAPRVQHTDYRYVDADGVVNLAPEPERIRVYDLDEVRGMLADAGLELVAAHAGHDLPPVAYEPDSPRLVVVATGSAAPR
jgi:SAM-dependent methyltransferase